MASIDYNGVAERRRQNGIILSLGDDAVPMVYPFLTNDPQLKQHFIDNKVYVATYWPNGVTITKQRTY